MARRGLRILSLDGGGTRGLSSLYILREIFDRVVPGHGGDVRPSEYFHLMGGSGISGLCVLLFARFCVNINEAIEFYSDILAELDTVEGLSSGIDSGVPNLDSWRDRIVEYDDDEPSERLEALRQALVQDKWQAAIKKWFPDSIDRFPFMQGGEFQYKFPLAQVAAGRARAFVVSSESPGYEKGGGTDASHQYHVPILHRAYYCKHARTSYTFYAIGLATVAVPEVMTPGVVFPTLLATGAHTAHNPSQLLLEESKKLWPGVRVGLLVSIGTGTFDVKDYELSPLSRICAEACFSIATDSERLHTELEQYVLPYDLELKCAYSRFNLPDFMPFFESLNKDYVLHEVRKWLQEPGPATKCAQLAQSLAWDGFPTALEDCLAITSLADLLQAALRSSYSIEAEILSDIISNYLLYEAASIESGSFQKLQLATTSSILSECLGQLYQAYDEDYTVAPDLGAGARAVVSAGVLYLSGDATDEYYVPSQMEQPSDIVAACYCFLISMREEEGANRRDRCPEFILQNLGALVGLPAETNYLFVGRVETLLKLATAAEVCQAGTVEALRGVKGILFNGTVIEHASTLLNDEPLDFFDEKVLIPFANAIATSISLGNWSKFRDKDILNLLSAVPVRTCNWAFVNLAIERLRLSEGNIDEDDLDQVTTICLSILQSRNSDFGTQRIKLVALSVRHGYKGLLIKCLTCRNLYALDSANVEDSLLDVEEILRLNVTSAGDTLLHLSCKLGYAHITESILRQLPKQLASAVLNQPNRLGQTALHLAAKYRGSNEIFWLLFSHGVDVNVQCKLGRTPLHYCFPDQSVLPEIHDVILELVKDYSLPTIAAIQKPKRFQPPNPPTDMDSRVRSFEGIATRLWRRMDYPLAQDAQGLTALSLAASRGWSQLFGVFFDDDSDHAEYNQHLLLKSRDQNGQICLDHARSAGSKGSVRGGEDLIAAEMTKRGIVVPPKIEERLTTLNMVEVRRATRSRSRERSPFPVSTPDDVLLKYGLVRGQEAAGQRQARLAGNAYFPFLETSSQEQDLAPASLTRAYNPEPTGFSSARQQQLQQLSADRSSLVQQSLAEREAHNQPQTQPIHRSPQSGTVLNTTVDTGLQVPAQPVPLRNKSSSPRRFLQRIRKGP